MSAGKVKTQRPAQKQRKQPGTETKMVPKPKFLDPDYEGSDKLLDKVAIITGGDSGIGRAVAIAYAIEGTNVVIAYLDEHEDAAKTKKLVEAKGRCCLTIAGDVSKPEFCKKIVATTLKEFKKIDILVNNAAQQFPQDDFAKITLQQLEKTFRINIFAYFYLTQAALPHLRKGASIINTTSVTAYRGSEHLIDYAATKGAIVAFTRSLAQNLVEKDIRVNGVAPGPIWTPLIPASFSAKEVKEFGSKTPMGRAGQPKEVSPSYVFLASEDASYFTGQILHPNGGEIVNG